MRQWMLKKATKEHFKFSDISFPHIWARMWIQLCNKLQCSVKIKWSLGLHSLLAPFYPTHSCHANPPKTSIFICHFAKTSFLASCCLKIRFKCFCLAFKALYDVVLLNISLCSFLPPRTTCVIDLLLFPVDSVRTELDCRTPSGCWVIAWCANNLHTLGGRKCWE